MARQSLLGNRLRRLRRERRLTQVEMAGALGISPSYLNLIEHNQRALPLPLLPKLAELYDVDIEAFSGGEEARILAELGELFADPLLRDHAVEPPALSELAGNRPELARAILTLYRAYRANRDDLIGLTERLAEDPELALTFHRLLTLLTTLRSTSEILQDNPELPDERRRRFVDVLARDSQSMAELVNELIDFFAGHGLRRPRGAASPADDVGDILQARANHLPELEALAETLHESLGLTPVNAGAVLARHLAEAHGLEVAVAGADQTAIGPPPYDRAEGRLVLPERLSHETRTFELARQLGFHGAGREIDALVTAAPLSSAPARALYSGALATYFAGALLMPYQAFLDSARALRHDLQMLRRRFGVGYEQVCRRLTTLQRPGAEGVPFHFLRVDPAGNILEWRSRSGLPIPRYGSPCPRWNVHTAFLTPGRIDTQLAQLTNGTTYLFVARAVTEPGPGHGSPKSHVSLAIGCEIAFASQLVYADGLDLGRRYAVTPVGVTCRQCERGDCAQRAFPSLVRETRGPAERAAE